MSTPTLIKLARNDARVTLNATSTAAEQVQFFFQSTAKEVTEAKIRALTQELIEDLNFSGAFKTAISTSNVKLDKFDTDKDGKVRFEVIINEAQFNNQLGNAQRAASTSILRTLNAYLPHSLKP